MIKTTPPIIEANTLLEIPAFLRRDKNPVDSTPTRETKVRWIMPKPSIKKKVTSQATVKTNKDLREALISLDYERKLVESLTITKVKDVLKGLATGKGCTMGVQTND